MYEVLIPVDVNEDSARAQARFVADLPDAENAVTATVFFVFTGEQESLPDELQQFKSADRVGSVRACKSVLEEANVSVSVRDESGNPAKGITEYAELNEPDLIVLGGRKRTPVGKAIFGSVAQSVILNTNHPVVVTGIGNVSQT